MTRKWRLIAWGIYTVGAFLVMLIGFNWRIAIPVSIIAGFFCGILNEIIQLSTQILDYLKKQE